MTSYPQYDPMQLYRAKRDSLRRGVAVKYTILGFISSGTYGRVYKAESKDEPKRLHAIKKFKLDKEGDAATYTGLSQSAIREIALNREIHHENVAALKEVILEDKSIYMVFEYAEHDFLQLIYHYSQTVQLPISQSVLKSATYQLLNGLFYLHEAHIIHRDLKPANILVTSSGVVKIGDLGLARLTYEPLQPLSAGDKVVVTIWYRAPELLLGAKHYTKSIDIWAVGCVLAELVNLRPIFKGEEAKPDAKKNAPFQKDQLLKIFETLGTPTELDWPDLKFMPEYHNMQQMNRYPPHLYQWCNNRHRKPVFPQQGYELLSQLFQYDPARRLTAKEALRHRWFQEDPMPSANIFHGIPVSHIPPQRRITNDAPSMMPMAAATQSLVTMNQLPHSSQVRTAAARGDAIHYGGGGQSRKKARLG
ncbi:kinase-like protein [Panus rudis PR-1116 ss-1]|nr:kinase-like protein [Panus rudis PR-1116 ss-1]